MPSKLPLQRVRVVQFCTTTTGFSSSRLLPGQRKLNHKRRSDSMTQQAIRTVADNSRRLEDAGDARDLALVVRSAARSVPGQRMLDDRVGQLRALVFHSFFPEAQD